MTYAELHLADHPIFVGAANARAVIGWEPRYLRDFARRQGLEILKADGAKWLVRVSDLVEAIERCSRATKPVAAVTDDDIADQMRREMGLRRIW